MAGKKNNFLFHKKNSQQKKNSKNSNFWCCCEKKNMQEQKCCTVLFFFLVLHSLSVLQNYSESSACGKKDMTILKINCLSVFFFFVCFSFGSARARSHAVWEKQLADAQEERKSTTSLFCFLVQKEEHRVLL